MSLPSPWPSGLPVWPCSRQAWVEPRRVAQASKTAAIDASCCWKTEAIVSFGSTIRLAVSPALLAFACMLPLAPAAAQHQHQATTALSAGDFGRVSFSTSCAPAAQVQFERAAAMLHSFHPEAARTFTQAAETDPACAMAWWGVAISQRPNPLVSPFPPEILSRGWAAIERARAAGPRTERERDWIEALALFFQDHERVDQRTRTRAYEAAMGRLAERYPDDDEAQIFYALALNEAVDLSDKTYARQLRAAGILERIEARVPDHPGIPHYLIHSYDYGPLAERGLASARRFAVLAPASGHALHMPSHTFSTLGLWQEAISADRASVTGSAARAAQAEQVITPEGLRAVPIRLHSLDFLANAHMQLAQDQPVARMVDALRAVGDPPPFRYSAHTGFAAIPVRYAFDRGAWAEAAALPVPQTPYAQAEAISWFGRAVGAARSGDSAPAAASLERIRALRGRLTGAGEAYWAEQVAIMEGAAAAWIAFGAGRRDEALSLMRAAADLEDRSEKHVAMENRLSPMREMLGEMLVEARQGAAALPEFEASLRANPNRYRSFAGAAKAAEQAGDRGAAQRWHERLLELTSQADTRRPEIDAARQFLGRT